MTMILFDSLGPWITPCVKTMSQKTRKLTGICKWAYGQTQVNRFPLLFVDQLFSSHVENQTISVKSKDRI